MKDQIHNQHQHRFALTSGRQTVGRAHFAGLHNTLL